ncbi:hypothetical protein GALL_522310 [mine drainage metagenome]|uniref:Uncharacterized protein n=1 Tax=mine drainage metagenome TaxID=410659 RepID=A0A1J5PLN0_9ZZZZ
MDFALIILLFTGMVSASGFWLDLWADGKPKDSEEQQKRHRKTAIKIISTLFVIIGLTFSYLNLNHERTLALRQHNEDSIYHGRIDSSYVAQLAAGNSLKEIKKKTAEITNKTDTVMSSLSTANKLINSNTADMLGKINKFGAITSRLEYPFDSVLSVRIEFELNNDSLGREFLKYYVAPNWEGQSRAKMFDDSHPLYKKFANMVDNVGLLFSFEKKNSHDELLIAKGKLRSVRRFFAYDTLYHNFVIDAQLSLKIMKRNISLSYLTDLENCNLVILCNSPQPNYCCMENVLHFEAENQDPVIKRIDNFPAFKSAYLYVEVEFGHKTHSTYKNLKMSQFGYFDIEKFELFNKTTPNDLKE